MVQGGGFEPPKLARQIYSLIPLATREPLRVFIFVLVATLKLQYLNWSWREESNPRPADYKSAALPTELRQQLFSSIPNRSRHIHWVGRSLWRRDSSESFWRKQHLNTNFVCAGGKCFPA